MVLFPLFIPIDFFGRVFQVDIGDYLIGLVLASIVDLDHIAVLRKFGFKKVVFAQKRLVQPLHNFFFIAVSAILSAFIALFVSKDLAAAIFIITAHLLWDIFEDVLVFGVSFRRWEKTWGLDQEELEKTYNEFLSIEAEKPKKQSRVGKIGEKIRERGGKLRERLGRKKAANTTETTS